MGDYGSPSSGEQPLPRPVSREELEELLRRRESGFSPAFRRIASFLLADYQRASFMTASELARAAGVSQPSVTRFISYLGFDGYARFQRTLQAIVRGEMKGPSRLWGMDGKVSGDVPYAGLVREELENLSRLGDTLASQAFRDAAASLADAREIVVGGFRASLALAEYTAFFLAKVHPRVRAFTRADSRSWEELSRLEPEGSCLLMYAFPRYAIETLEFQRFARSLGFSVVLVTDSSLSPLARHADCTLVAPVAFRSLFDSYCAPMVLANALIQEVARRHPERTEAMLRRFEELAEQRKLFVAL